MQVLILLVVLPVKQSLTKVMTQNVKSTLLVMML